MKTITFSAEFPEFKGQTYFTGRGQATEWTSALSRAAKDLKRQIKHKRFTSIRATISVSDSGELSPEQNKVMTHYLGKETEYVRDPKLDEPDPEPVRKTDKPPRCLCTHSQQLHVDGLRCCHRDPEDNERDCFCMTYEEAR